MAAQKELKVVRRRDGLLEIKYEGGGEVPAVLQGVYNSQRVAQQAITLYLATRRKRSNGKKQS